MMHAIGLFFEAFGIVVMCGIVGAIALFLFLLSDTASRWLERGP
jgi:hypothetical protein